MSNNAMISSLYSSPIVTPFDISIILYIIIIENSF
nr:MAG TPA: hypothetical protein [Caudoviricetes sp.]